MENTLYGCLLGQHSRHRALSSWGYSCLLESHHELVQTFVPLVFLKEQNTEGTKSKMLELCRVQNTHSLPVQKTTSTYWSNVKYRMSISDYFPRFLALCFCIFKCKIFSHTHRHAKTYKAKTNFHFSKVVLRWLSLVYAECAESRLVMCR